MPGKNPSRVQPRALGGPVLRNKLPQETRTITPEAIWLRRRELLRNLGVGAAGGILASIGNPVSARGQDYEANTPADLQRILSQLPTRDAPRNPRYTTKRPLTPRGIAARYNNFYEFSTRKSVWREAQSLTTHPWEVQVDGLVHKPKTWDVDALLKRMPLEERIYRLRCVEAWSMVVPWSGFPLHALLSQAEPLGSARYVRFSTFHRPQEAPRQGEGGWFTREEPWPYREGMTLPEAMNELTLIAVGVYGHALPKQHGAPVRLLIPWKYGFKSIKSIVRITLTEERPVTFWNTLAPSEYGFLSNVNPQKPHPRWSQAFERDIATRERIPTQPYNGYGEFVAQLYKG